MRYAPILYIALFYSGCGPSPFVRDGSDATDAGKEAVFELLADWRETGLYSIPVACADRAMQFREIVATEESMMENWCAQRGDARYSGCMLTDDGHPYVVRWHEIPIPNIVKHEMTHWLQWCATKDSKELHFGPDTFHRDQRVWWWNAGKLGISPVCNEKGVVREYLEALPRRCSAHAQ